LWIHYKINPDLPEWVLELISKTAQGCKNSSPYHEDNISIAEMPNRPELARQA
jgi:ArsR family transcriptional regulator